MKTAAEILDAAGDEWVKHTFGVGSRAVAHYRALGKLPALWYAALCERTGETLPVSLFTFKGLEAAE